jgi:IS1 family transposase
LTKCRCANTPTGQIVRWALRGIFAAKKFKVWVKKAFCRTTLHLVDWACGDRSDNTFRRLYERLKRFNVDVFFADNYDSYRNLIPPEQLAQTKAQTHNIE